MELVFDEGLVEPSTKLRQRASLLMLLINNWVVAIPLTQKLMKKLKLWFLMNPIYLFVATDEMGAEGMIPSEEFYSKNTTTTINVLILSVNRPRNFTDSTLESIFANLNGSKSLAISGALKDPIRDQLSLQSVW
ncbi:hypothetical protein PanWU01x14_307740 [Parasponia andersonii]|uniref:Uncharacterized protein n=1 Tax=Parasponia andersonii TaxID=3476 RepID=A0A2P5ARC0_PARAD|nr:hypothetical protein PanWU01x14_307740 [Parasponia andersonii]